MRSFYFTDWSVFFKHLFCKLHDGHVTNVVTVVTCTEGHLVLFQVLSEYHQWIQSYSLF